MRNSRLEVKTLVYIMIWTCFFGASAMADDTPGDGSAKIAVLPFTMHTPSELSYLQDGIQDMLSSRLGWQGKVQVLDRTSTDQALKGPKSTDLSADDALRIGRALKADYVLFGSVTGDGQSISIEAKMVKVTGTGEPISLNAQMKSLDEVIPRINQFAQEINQQAFAKPSEKNQAAAGEDDTVNTRNPELLVPDSKTGSMK